MISWGKILWYPSPLEAYTHADENKCMVTCEEELMAKRQNKEGTFIV